MIPESQYHQLKEAFVELLDRCLPMIIESSRETVKEEWMKTAGLNNKNQDDDTSK